jgi:hypothetical protein
MTNLITLSIFHINKFCTEIILINQRTREHITYWDLIICMTTYRKNAWLLNTHESTSCVCKANPLTNIGLQFPIFNKCQHSSTHSYPVPPWKSMAWHQPIGREVSSYTTCIDCILRWLDMHNGLCR